MAELKTIEVIYKEDGRELIINEDDFDKSIHKRIGDIADKDEDTDKQENKKSVNGSGNKKTGKARAQGG